MKDFDPSNKDNYTDVREDLGFEYQHSHWRCNYCNCTHPYFNSLRHKPECVLSDSSQVTILKRRIVTLESIIKNSGNQSLVDSLSSLDKNEDTRARGYFKDVETLVSEVEDLIRYSEWDIKNIKERISQEKDTDTDLANLVKRTAIYFALKEVAKKCPILFKEDNT